MTLILFIKWNDKGRRKEIKVASLPEFGKQVKESRVTGILHVLQFEPQIMDIPVMKKKKHPTRKFQLSELLDKDL